MNIALVGFGSMGEMIYEFIKDEVKCIVSSRTSMGIASLFDYHGKIDLIIDFSNKENLNMIYDYASVHKTKVLIGTTGYSDIERAKINKLSLSVPVMLSENYSMGIIIMNRVLKEITPILKDLCDIEIIESHHNKKLDSPSGTAKMLLSTIKNSTGYVEKFLRVGNEKREPNEIGVHSIRGGSVVGEHEVQFLGFDELLSIKHTALSKKIFAIGAIKAARWLEKMPKGLYNMENVFDERTHVRKN